MRTSHVKSRHSVIMCSIFQCSYCLIDKPASPYPGNACKHTLQEACCGGHAYSCRDHMKISQQENVLYPLIQLDMQYVMEYCLYYHKDLYHIDAMLVLQTPKASNMLCVMVAYLLHLGMIGHSLKPQ